MRRALTAFLFSALLISAGIARGQGIIVTGVGPVNRSMGGAGTAAPLDAIGAVHWNPASLNAMERSQVSFGLEGLSADIQFSTNIGGVHNHTDGDSGIASIPAVGWVHRLEDTPISLGLGVYGIGGFRNVMPANPNDPILASGPLFADAELMQIAPTLSYALTDQLSIGVAPTITSGRLMVDPLGPSAITPDSVHGTGNRVHWGAGFQVGVFYTTETDWQLGFTFKSPQWFEEFQFYTPSGVVGFDLDYPMILSWGVAYRGFSRWVFTTDLRYIDYKNTDGFDALGWRSIFALATGVQYQLTDIIALRAGYNYNQNPIQGEDVLANIATPLIQTQNVAAGVTLTLTENVDAVFSYIYLIDNTVTGALPEGVFGPGATMSHRIRAHSFSLGLTVSY